MMSEKIRNLRRDFNISQVELANKLCVTKQCVSNWENDNILPSVEMLIKLAKSFNVSTDYLLGLDSDNVIDIDTIVKATKIISPIIDEKDFIKESYVLDVSSKEKGVK